MFRHPIDDSAKYEDNKTPVQVDEAKLDTELTAVEGELEKDSNR